MSDDPPPAFGPSPIEQAANAIQALEYGTRLPPDREQDFATRWLPEVARRQGRTVEQVMRDEADYDLRGAYAVGAMPDDRGHLTDVGKKPNHPTFSDQSIYHGRAGAQGGRWDTHNGADRFTAGPTNLQHFSPRELREYFQREEPGVTLVIPQSALRGGRR